MTVSSEAERIKERSVDSLQQIYAVVIALAIAQAIQSLLKDPVSGAVLARIQILVGLPAFVAFLVTLVPFWHGMNRHLDRCYLEKKSAVVQGALVAIVIAILIVDFPFQHKTIVLIVVAIMRSIADYGLCWDFYFPRQ